jgi:EAL domain-containing protein (putative c-di-GMP-specific phosphodiesterase class I)
MYRAKEYGRGRYEVFRSDFRRKVLKYLEMETLLRRGLANDEFHVHYQPVVALSDYRVVGFEALLRWNPEGHPVIPPAEFIPVAEESGLIIAMGEWALRTACRQLRVWQERFPSQTPLWMSVNLSTIQFMQPNLGQNILKMLQETGLPPTSLRLEITESHFMENPQLAVKMLQALVDQGVKISIDDFGTGYSSLSLLHQYPIHTLKIDRTFITLMDTTDKNRDIVRTIIQLARNLNMETIAEGVETHGQSLALSLLECPYAQGFIFSCAYAAEQIETILRDGGILSETAHPDGGD